MSSYPYGEKKTYKHIKINSAFTFHKNKSNSYKNSNYTNALKTPHLFENVMKKSIHFQECCDGVNHMKKHLLL